MTLSALSRARQGPVAQPHCLSGGLDVAEWRGQIWKRTGTGVWRIATTTVS